MVVIIRKSRFHPLVLRGVYSLIFAIAINIFFSSVFRCVHPFGGVPTPESYAGGPGKGIHPPPIGMGAGAPGIRPMIFIFKFNPDS